MECCCSVSFAKTRRDATDTVVRKNSGPDYAITWVEPRWTISATALSLAGHDKWGRVEVYASDRAELRRTFR
jgi:hypothetical protein